MRGVGLNQASCRGEPLWMKKGHTLNLTSSEEARTAGLTNSETKVTPQDGLKVTMPNYKWVTRVVSS